MPDLPAPITVRAHAKANLYLRILGTRPDGYHDLASVFQALSLADTLEFVPEAGRTDLQLRSTHPTLPQGRDNLITQAYDLLIERYPDRCGHRGLVCRLDKQIPMQAGLGGGSADAAATLVALNALWGLELSPAEMGRLGLELGSDVPFALLGATAFGTGRGESLTPLPPIRDLAIVLILPRFGVSTKEAFGWWDSRLKGDPPADPPGDTPASTPDTVTAGEIQALWSAAILTGSWQGNVHNDFEVVVCDHYPSLAAMRESLRGHGAVPVLTGSGSGLLGLCRDLPHALAVAERYIPLDREEVRVIQGHPGPAVEFPSAYR